MQTDGQQKQPVKPKKGFNFSKEWPDMLISLLFSLFELWIDDF